MDPQFFLQADMALADVYPLDGGHAGVFSARSPDKETPNEDAAAILPIGEDAAILVVADGLGGSPAGGQASGLAIRELIGSIRQSEALRADDTPPNFRATILDGIESANRAITDLGVGAATTMAIAEIHGRTVRPYHVGDSMIMAVGQRGKIKLQTISHSPVGYAVESGMLDEAEAMHHDERHVVSNVIGTPDMRIEVGSTIELAQYDTLLLATDGLFDNFHVEEIVERIRKGPMHKVTECLVTDCRRRMAGENAKHPSKADDLTFVVFRPRPLKR